MSEEPLTRLDADLVLYVGKVIEALKSIEETKGDTQYEVLRVVFGFDGEEIPEMTLEKSLYGEMHIAVYSGGAE